MALTELEELELLELENENILSKKNYIPSIEQSRETNLEDLVKNTNKFLKTPSNFAPFSPIAKLTYGLATTPEAKEFGKGFAETSSFGTLGEKLENPQIISPSMSLSKGIGRMAGSFIPPIISAATGGQAAAMSGLGRLGQSVATGLTMGAAEGAVEGRGGLPAISKAAERGLEFSLIHGAGKALGGLRKVLGEEFSDTLSNLFLKTDLKTAKELVRKNEPSLGKQALDFGGKFNDNPLAGFKSRKEVLQNAKNEMGYLRNEAAGIVEKIENEANKPAIKPINNRLLLGYEPNLPKTRIPVINIPAEYTPESLAAVSLPRTSRIGERFVEPKVGTIPGIEDFGERTVGGLSSYSGKFQKGKGIGSFELESEPPAPLRFPKETAESFKKRTADFLEWQNRKKLRRLPEDVKGAYREQFKINYEKEQQRITQILDDKTSIDSLKSETRDWQKDYPFTFEKKGPFINIKNIIEDVMPEVNKLKRVGEKTGPSKGMIRILDDFQKSNPKEISVNDALMVKTTLDKIVNDAYKNDLIDNSYSDQIYRQIANSLRRKIYKISPNLGENFDKQSLLHDVINSLEPTQAKTGNISIGGFFRFLGQQATGNQLGLGTATVLNRTMGSSSKRIAPFTRIGVQGSLLNYDPLNNNE